jgi:LuxR family maltose regulon positive regulatory protein
MALAFHAVGQVAAAGSALSRTISLARPEGYVRVFLDLGRPMRDLLAVWSERGAAATGSLAATTALDLSFARELLDAFENEQDIRRLQENQRVLVPSAMSGVTIEPLTEREREVVSLLSAGLSNKEIAAKLVIAPSTVKQHLKNIYSKLEVHNRTQAVARARDLGIL